ncbi:MAG: hypothetical protein Q6365_022945, partial [Candidatus Sigynarchaeota archaeon]
RHARRVIAGPQAVPRRVADRGGAHLERDHAVRVGLRQRPGRDHPRRPRVEDGERGDRGVGREVGWPAGLE